MARILRRKDFSRRLKLGYYSWVRLIIYIPFYPIMHPHQVYSKSIYCVFLEEMECLKLHYMFLKSFGLSLMQRVTYLFRMCHIVKYYILWLFLWMCYFIGDILTHSLLKIFLESLKHIYQICHVLSLHPGCGWYSRINSCPKLILGLPQYSAEELLNYKEL